MDVKTQSVEFRGKTLPMKLWVLSCEMDVSHIQEKPICVSRSFRSEEYKNRTLQNWKNKGHKKIVVEEFEHIKTEYVS